MLSCLTKNEQEFLFQKQWTKDPKLETISSLARKSYIKFER